ncbi:MAG: tripartite tricarboxylate transporter substrate binding protein [Comamonadaceae bacterium]|nr:MAG: tripartite tricarboxylate transporter substrate binding protein [Comamonadaceae bacterium]
MFRHRFRLHVAPALRTVAATAIALTALPGTSAEAAYPERPITVLVPFPAGGINDTIARPVLQKLGEALGADIIVENKPGASGMIGSSQAARAKPDGYTLLLGAASTLAVVPQMNATAGYDPLIDLTPVGGIASVASILVTGKPDRYPNLKAVHAAALARPGDMTYGSAGVGTSQHMQMAQYNLQRGLSMMHVPYRGGAPAMTDLVGGQIDLMMEPVATALPQIRGSKVIPLAISQKTRSPLVPDVPTFEEAGLPQYIASTWFSLMAPAGTDPATVALLSDKLVQVLAAPEIVKNFEARGIQTMPLPAADMAAYLREEHALWGKVIKEANIPTQ